MDIRDLFAGKTEHELLEFKADEVCIADPIGVFESARYNLTIEIVGIERIERGVSVFVKAWQDQQQLGFGDGTVEIERIRVFGCPILVDDPSGDITQQIPDAHDAEVTRIHRYRKDAAQALRDSIAHTVSVVKKDGSNIVPGKIGTTTTTLNPAAGAVDPVDGMVGHQTTSDTWANTRGGAGNEAAFGASSVRIGVHAFLIGGQFMCRRCVVLFKSADIGTGQTVSAATLSMAGNGDGITNPSTTNVALGACTPASDAAIANGDFSAGVTLDTPTEFITRVAFSALVDTAGTYNDFAFNASGIAAIDVTTTTGRTRVSFRTGTLDVDNNAPANTADNLVFWRAADHGSTPPKLVVTHATAAVTASPLSNLLLLGV